MKTLTEHMIKNILDSSYYNIKVFFLFWFGFLGGGSKAKILEVFNKGYGLTKP